MFFSTSTRPNLSLSLRISSGLWSAYEMLFLLCHIHRLPFAHKHDQTCINVRKCPILGSSHHDFMISNGFLRTDAPPWFHAELVPSCWSNPSFKLFGCLKWWNLVCNHDMGVLFGWCCCSCRCRHRCRCCCRCHYCCFSSHSYNKIPYNSWKTHTHTPHEPTFTQLSSPTAKKKHRASAQVRLHWLEARPLMICTLGLRSCWMLNDVLLE